MIFLLILLSIVFIIAGIIWIGFLKAELFHGQKSVVTPIGFIVLGIVYPFLKRDAAWVGIIFLVIGIVWLTKYISDKHTGIHEMEREREQQQIETERQNAIASQQQGEPWAIRFMTSPCPFCGHYKVRCAKWEDKRLSVAFWGVASDDLGKNYKCEHCQRMWE